MSEIHVEHIHWLGHDSFRIYSKDAVIYIDPWQLGEHPQAADCILITHDHSDHCSPDDVKKIQKEGTTIVTVQAAADKLEGAIEIVKPGDIITCKGIKIEVLPAYNLNKFRSPGVPFHPKDKGYVGYLLTIDGQRIYHAGDTDVIPEMALLAVDIALLPVSGTYVMTANEAVEAAELIQPAVVIPMHVGRGIGSVDDLETFQAMCSIPVKILAFESA